MMLVYGRSHKSGEWSAAQNASMETTLSFDADSENGKNCISQNENESRGEEKIEIDVACMPRRFVFAAQSHIRNISFYDVSFSFARSFSLLFSPFSLIAARKLLISKIFRDNFPWHD